MSSFIIDGYNLIKTWPDLRDQALQDARTGLIRLLERFAIGKTASIKRRTIILVFDGRADIDAGSPHSSIIRVVFTKGEKADDYIKRFIDDHAAGRLSVVSNDREIQNYGRRSRIQRYSIDGFMREVHVFLKPAKEPLGKLKSSEEAGITEYLTALLTRKYEKKQR